MTDGVAERGQPTHGAVSYPSPDAGQDEPVMKVVRSREGLSSAYATLRRPAFATARAQRAVVMTMGALHEGHAGLMRAARGDVGDGGHVTVTIFVNPLQFGASEDLDKYPRTLEDDIALCAREDVDLVFAPTDDVVYPHGAPATRIKPGPLADILEGAIRPGHFEGVLTVVAKLLNLTGADVAYFGEKDYQQLTLIRQMARDLDIPTRIAGAPTVREPDGMALSSRNRFLSPEDRVRATAISAALKEGEIASELGRGEAAIVGAAELELMRAGLEVDYVSLVSPDMGPAPTSGKARLLIAARVGGVRLLDNCPIVLRS